MNIDSTTDILIFIVSLGGAFAVFKSTTLAIYKEAAWRKDIKRLMDVLLPENDKNILEKFEELQNNLKEYHQSSNDRYDNLSAKIGSFIDNCEQKL